MYLATYKKLGLPMERLLPVKTPLAGFTGDAVDPEGSTSLVVELGSWPNVKKMDMEFVVVASEYMHNIIHGRSGL